MSASESETGAASPSNNHVRASASNPSSSNANSAAAGHVAEAPALYASTYAKPVNLAAHSLKYHGQIAKFSDCPPKGSGEHTDGFRVCFADLQHEKHFLPNAIADLTRLDGRAPTPCCSSYALSLFTTLPALVKHTQAILRTNRKFLLKKGDHYAQLILAPKEGRSTVATNDGHFDFFEYTNFNAVSRIKAHAKMPL